MTAVKVKRLNKDVKMPVYNKEGDSGFDLTATEDVLVHPLETALVPTGLAFSFSKGYEIQIRPRSGMSLNTGLTIPNSPGTVDANYRGEVKVIVRNLGSKPLLITAGSRFAQAVVCPVVTAEFEEVLTLDDTERADNGFGSTGV